MVTKPPHPLPEPPLTLEADVKGDAGEGCVDDVTQVHFLLLVEIELPSPAAGVTEGDELLRVEAIERLPRKGKM